jgi:hypothetical protein
MEGVATWVAAATVGVFLTWSAVRFDEITALMYQNADIAIAPVMAELLDERGSGYVTLGFYPWLESLYALHLTRWVPDHVAFWKLAPFLVYGATVALMGWTVKRAVSKRTGFLVALAMAAPAPLVIYFLGAPNQRLPVLAHAVLLSAFLVTLPRLADWGWLRRAVWGVLLAVTLAPGVASDPLVVLSGVLPFLAAMGLGRLMKLLSADTAAVAAGACLAGAAGGWLLEALAEDHRIVYFHNPDFVLASGGRVLSNVGLLFEDVALFAHGQFAISAEPIDAFNVARALVAILAIVAVLVFVFVLARSARDLLADDARAPLQRLLTIYWVVSIVAVAAAFVIVTTPVEINSVRYVTNLWPALLALLAIRFRERANIGLAVLAALSAIIGCVELSRGLYTFVSQPPPEPEEVSSLESFVDTHDLDHGYANYWDAIPITYQSDFRVRAFPIEPCWQGSELLCEIKGHTIDAWYEPQQDVRSFYVVGDQTLFPALAPPSSRLGAPFAVASFGDLTAYAFDFDIASKIRTRRGSDGAIEPRTQVTLP